MIKGVVAVQGGSKDRGQDMLTDNLRSLYKPCVASLLFIYADYSNTMRPHTKSESQLLYEPRIRKILLLRAHRPKRQGLLSIESKKDKGELRYRDEVWLLEPRSTPMKHAPFTHCITPNPENEALQQPESSAKPTG